ncbi:MAG: 50S ribosomal protein L11 methyltransferase [Betaproteobacteria bacterium]|nr:MAG: 50S ribosomal protein L11 methyltransferase [Betaproteobacteria bacterium]
MGLVAVRFDTGGEVADRWGDALLDAGAIAVDVAEAPSVPDVQMVLETEPEQVLPHWKGARLTALFEADADIDAAIARAEAAIGQRLAPHVIEAIREDDWVQRSRDQFRPVRVTERIWIVPSWCKPVEPSAVNITIDPGLAFGTGTHPSTRLCIRWLDANLRRDASVLDYGCGSGILAITAALLGAGSVTGIDIDPQALNVIRHNARVNAVRGRFMRPRSLKPRSFDVVVANILARPLDRLAPQFARRVRIGGSVVLSGILAAQAPALVQVYARWFNIGIWGGEDGWVALAGSRRNEHGR